MTPCSQVLSLAHQHLAAVDERLRQLHVFRDQLASELAQWDQRKTAVTCDGLCQFIADAAPDISAPKLERDAPRRRPRSGRVS